MKGNRVNLRKRSKVRAEIKGRYVNGKIGF